MPDILHKVGVKASSPDATYKALATIPGLAGWWTTDTQGDSEVGGVIRFRFGPKAAVDMKVLELERGKRVAWQVVGGPDDWVGTTIRFDLTQAGDRTMVLFKHEGWREPGEFMAHCSTKWATFLLSLKSLSESGKGAPFPHDVQITD